MRWKAFGVIAFAALFAAASAFAASKKDWDDCHGDDPDRAIAACTRVVNDRSESQKNRAVAYNSRALAWDEKRDYDRAIADYNDAIRLDPKYAGAYYNRGLAWRGKGDFDRAIADFTTAIKLGPTPGTTAMRGGTVNKLTRDQTLADYYYNRGRAWRAKKDYDRAIADYNEAIRLDPKAPVYYYNRAAAWFAKGDLDRAIADYNQAIRLDPKYDIAYYDRGDAWRSKGDLDRAIADFNEAIRLDPKYDLAFNDRGLAWPRPRHRRLQRGDPAGSEGRRLS